ncbi:hypothetical protein [Streptomyces afghaniensis]|uniref:hypothetical protein n=1 Tax=Streptomyces afghaniensis TaxID=66865 RepID=UPI0027D83217|nr:hypothetical protein [Streptomyces afghaniensis]
MSAALVIRVHEQVCQLVDGAPDAGDVTGDGRSDPVAVLGHPLPIFAVDDPSAVIELAVATRRVPAGEVTEKN